MKDVYTVSFFGNKKIYDPRGEDTKLFYIITKLLNNKERVRFLLVRDGMFEEIVDSSLTALKKDCGYKNYSIKWVKPSKESEYIGNAESLESYQDNAKFTKGDRAFSKSSLIKRNRNMVDLSNLCVFYVGEKKDVAYETMRYAIKQHKKIINLLDVNTANIIDLNLKNLFDMKY